MAIDPRGPVFHTFFISFSEKLIFKNNKAFVALFEKYIQTVFDLHVQVNHINALRQMFDIVNKWNKKIIVDFYRRWDYNFGTQQARRDLEA